MNALPTIPRATMLDALRRLGLDEVDSITEVGITGDFVTVHRVTPDPYIPRYRVVDECPSCHTADGHPHTDYCQLQDAGARLVDMAVGMPGEPLPPLPDSAYPTDSTPLPEPVPWVDNGCRCPNPDHEHLPGCPTLGPVTLTQDGVTDLVGQLRKSVEAAKTRRAHANDAELDDGKGTMWHQTGPDDAHERWHCEPAKCGWDPLQP